MTIKTINKYLQSRISNWYHNSLLDYGISGRYIKAEVQGNNLHVIWEEENERQELEIAWFGEYTFEQIYNIWMEAA